MSDFKSQLSGLLSFCTKDYQEPLDKICEKYSDFSLLAQTDREVLTELCGEKCADMLRILACANSRAITEKFKFGIAHSEEEIKEFLLGYYFDSANESVIALPLNSKGYILAAEQIFEGTVNCSEIIPRKVIEIMLRYNSKNVIIAHNHPRGAAGASDEDVAATQKLDYILSTADKQLLCHYIIAPGEVLKILPIKNQFGYNDDGTYYKKR